MTTLSSIPVTKNTTLGDFCNPRSALTLTASSGMVLAFTTTLGNAFGLPMALTALLLSALFAILQIINSPEKMNIPAKIIYTMITTLIIFHVARGGNMTLSVSENALRQTESISMTLPSLVNSANAEENGTILGIHNYMKSCTETSKCMMVVSQESTNKPPTIFRPW